MSTVLIIEDDSEIRSAMADLFAGGDWNVLQASEGDTGIDLAIRHQPEVIVCDLLMPRANGFQVCRAIRQQLQPAKIIVVTGRDYEVDRTTAFEAGADEYLVKPVTWESLSGAIDRLLPKGRGPIAPTTSDGAESEPMRLRIWGVRGSIPVPGSETVRYGGNTSCLEIRADGEIIVLDAGSGIRPLGLSLEEEFGSQPIQLTLLITHTHWDHIQGLPFFSPAYDKKNLIRVLGYEGARAGLGKILAGQMETPFFPVSLRDLPSHIVIEELKDMAFDIGRVHVLAKFANHPGICTGYRLFTKSGSIVFLPDNEPYEPLKIPDRGTNGERSRQFATAERNKMLEFLRDSDVALIDTQYTDDEYPRHVGWGHGCLSSVVSLALDAGVRKLLLFHHDPNHDDKMIDTMVEQARAQVAKTGKVMEVEAAREGTEIVIGATAPGR